jgi:hypothetical protein
LKYPCTTDWSHFPVCAGGSCRRRCNCCLICCSFARFRLLADFAPHHEFSLGPVSSTDVCETQEVERLGLTFPSLFPISLGVPPELDPAQP